MATSIEQPGLGQDEPNPTSGIPSLTPSSVDGSGPNGDPVQYMAVILQSLQTMKNGDFSARLPVTGFTPRLASVAAITARSRQVTEIEHCMK